MLLIVCPYCGKRPELEFTYGGQAHLVRPAQPRELDDQTWTDFLYMRTNTKGVYAERWRHARGCGRFFNAVRDTTTDFFITTYKSGESKPPLPGVDSVSGADASGDSGPATGVGSAAGLGSAAGSASVAGSGSDGSPRSAAGSGSAGSHLNSRSGSAGDTGFDGGSDSSGSRRAT